MAEKVLVVASVGRMMDPCFIPEGTDRLVAEALEAAGAVGKFKLSVVEQATGTPQRQKKVIGTSTDGKSVVLTFQPGGNKTCRKGYLSPVGEESTGAQEVYARLNGTYVAPAEVSTKDAVMAEGIADFFGRVEGLVFDRSLLHAATDKAQFLATYCREVDKGIYVLLPNAVMLAAKEWASNPSVLAHVCDNLRLAEEQINVAEKKMAEEKQAVEAAKSEATELMARKDVVAVEIARLQEEMDHLPEKHRRATGRATKHETAREKQALLAETLRQTLADEGIQVVVNAATAFAALDSTLGK